MQADIVKTQVTQRFGKLIKTAVLQSIWIKWRTERISALTHGDGIYDTLILRHHLHLNGHIIKVIILQNIELCVELTSAWLMSKLKNKHIWLILETSLLYHNTNILRNTQASIPWCFIDLKEKKKIYLQRKIKVLTLV